MQVIEIIIYLSMSIIIGFMILNFIFEINYNSIFDKINEDMNKDNQNNFLKIKKNELIPVLNSFWDKSGMCEVESSLALYIDKIKPEDNLSKEYIFNEIKAIGFCSNIQSMEYNCGTNEDLEFYEVLPLPRIIRLSCNVSNHKMVIN
jgi:hypothetical protein